MDTFDLIVTPFLTFLVMSILGLFAIGPVFHSLETVVLDVTKQILTLPFGLASLIVGGVQQIIVVTGIHHIFNFLELQLLTNGDKTNPLNAYWRFPPHCRFLQMRSPKSRRLGC